jgi:hypothetical protein
LKLEISEIEKRVYDYLMKADKAYDSLSDWDKGTRAGYLVIYEWLTGFGFGEKKETTQNAKKVM